MVNTFVCQFLDTDQGVATGKKREGPVNSEIGGRGTCYTLVLGVKENFMQSLSVFYFVFGDLELRNR